MAVSKSPSAVNNHEFCVTKSPPARWVFSLRTTGSNVPHQHPLGNQKPQRKLKTFAPFATTTNSGP